jgi:hypothetical protein
VAKPDYSEKRKINAEDSEDAEDWKSGGPGAATAQKLKEARNLLS